MKCNKLAGGFVIIPAVATPITVFQRSGRQYVEYAAPVFAIRGEFMGDHVRFRVVCGPQNEEASFVLRSGEILKVGRSPQAQLIVRSTQVSRFHCEVGMNGEGVFVRDTNSNSGTFVSGQRIAGEQRLRDGDQISIGPAVIQIGLAGHRSSLIQTPLPLETIADIRESLPAQPELNQTIAAPQDFAQMEAAPQDKRIELSGDQLTIGRDPACQVVLDSLVLSRRHARLRRKDKVWFVEDLGSTNGSYLNGQRLKKSTALKIGDVLKIGAFQFRYNGTHLISRSLAKDGIRISVRGLVKQVRNAASRQPIRLLDGVSFQIEPGEFIGLLGPSGCGKSTLMDALNGRRPGTEGEVFYNDDDLYENFESYSTGIGYVPQELIFHDSLPVSDALRYTSRLRLSNDISRSDLEANIDRVLRTVGLEERRDTLIRNLSGGQKKRVSVAVELISKPSVLFLDEVTSGLDMATEREMMKLFRELADGGVTIICITHYLESLSQCNRLACLMRGRLVFYGMPEGLKEHFEIGCFADVYDLASRKTPEQWEEAFRLSHYFAQLPPMNLVADDSSKGKFGKGLDVDRFRRQVPVLTRRYHQLLVTDRTMPLILMVLAPAIGLLLCLLTSGLTSKSLSESAATVADAANFKEKQVVLCFGSVLVIMFLSLFGAVQEVVKELRVYHHERSVNLMVVPYMISKIVPLAVIGAIQSVLILLVVDQIGGLQAGSVARQFGILFITSLTGTTLGLAISAWVPESLGDSAAASEAAAATKAVTLMNAVVIPQVLFAGSIVALTGASKILARCLISSYWALQAFQTLNNLNIPDKFKDMRDNSLGVWLCMLMLGLHTVVFTVAFFVGMVRKDGPGAFRRLVRTLPRDDRGRIAHDRMLAQFKGLLKMT